MEWGFIATPSIVLDTIPEVKAFTEEIAKAGSWNGEAVEGFVVRTRVTASPTKGNKPASASPYPVGSSFFFKVKFDEPYMMYRDWREVTKTLLSKGASASNVPKNKLRRPETKLYVQWVCGEITRDRTQFTEFTKGKGIIATRERFLEWVASGGQLVQDAAEAVPEETGSKKEVDLTKGKTIIVPVAIPGVGTSRYVCSLTALFCDMCRVLGLIWLVEQARRRLPLRSHTSSASGTCRVMTSTQRSPPRSLSRTSSAPSRRTTLSSPTSTSVPPPCPPPLTLILQEQSPAPAPPTATRSRPEI